MVFERGRWVQNIMPVIQQFVTPELMVWASEQAKALYGVGTSPSTQKDREPHLQDLQGLQDLKQLGGRNPTLRELERIQMLLPEQRRSVDSSDFLIFSL